MAWNSSTWADNSNHFEVTTTIIFIVWTIAPVVPVTKML
jgi:hypothetical protein